MVDKKKLKDSEAKDILRKWPSRTNTLWTPPTGSGFWLRAQPPDAGEGNGTPTIRLPGAGLFKTQPDGMWIFVDEDRYADVVSVEICGTMQNFNDKRSRYSSAVRSLILHLPVDWLTADIKFKGLGRKKRWEAMGSITGGKPIKDVQVPVRYLRVLFALPNTIYAKWSKQGVADGHEYFCRHSSLDSYNSQQAQAFLPRLSQASHFLTRPGGN